MVSSICNVWNRFAHPGGTEVVIFRGAMKPSLIAILTLLTAAVAFAGDSATTPDYSRDTVLKILHDNDVEEAPFKINVGTIDINTKAMRYHFAYLPLLAPLPYSGPQGARYLPNPFVLTHTEYAWRPHQFKAEPDFDDPEYRSEYRRTAKELSKQHVVVSQ